ncbi:cytosolic phospholipase A2 gamma-like [Halichoeres trimaculatus]|uniref:cytosolic phospholipase A2 gamma-like n=1 Tax=Halichoeres trimaculatus TaxID=147232 RepID=UPI003D9EF7D6
MEGEKAAPELVRESRSLCAGEQEYVIQRKKKVLESLMEQKIHCAEDSVPHIALLGSGGGERAAMGLLGSLHQMQKDKLLDFMLYMGGVSGSTWSMAFLYTDPEWSMKMDQAIHKLMNSEVDMEEALSWLKERAKDENFSLTDIWGLMTTAGIMKQMELGKLSDPVNRNPNNPYPIYCAVEKYSFKHGPIEGKWFEGSPHEAGFTELGLFVETPFLGSKFQNGELMEKKREMDMVKLQGILGSALASEGKIKEYIEHWLHDHNILEAVHGVYLSVYNALHELIHLARRVCNYASNLLDHLYGLLTGTDKAHQEEHPELESKSDEEKTSVFQKWAQKLIDVVKDWAQSLEDGPLQKFFSFITEHVLPLIEKWEWGTTNNFLYKYQDSSAPNSLTSMKKIHLMDAGLLMNVPYPSFLGDKRDIDLIIAPEFSAGEMFQTLTLAREYACTVKKPFPAIDKKILEEKNFPKDCYVFEGRGKEPTIVYLPLFNTHNCKTQEEFHDKMQKFSTFQGPFDKEQTKEVLTTAMENMSRNKETLLREISNAVVRRHNKGKTTLKKLSDTCLFGLV